MAFQWFIMHNEPERAFEFRCASCGEVHRGSPFFAYDRPYDYFAVPAEERNERVVIDDDTCVIDNDLFLIRTILEIPIEGAEEPFTWGVWVSQSRASFARYIATFSENQSGDSSFGWLRVTMPGYANDGGELAALACDVRWGDSGQRPTVLLHESDHALYRDQVNGITWNRAISLARLTMHGR